MRAYKLAKLVDATIAVLFVAAVFVPAILYVSGVAQPNAQFIGFQERRLPATRPVFSWTTLTNGEFRRALEPWIADALPLRSRLVEGYDSLVFRVFGGEPSKDVIRGRDGWLFYGNEEERYLSGAYDPTDADLDYIAAVFRDRSAWCARHGVHYVLALVPNKSTIYAPMLPARIRRATPTPLERLVPRLRAARVDTVDLQPTLAAGARVQEVYSRGDTHWNDVGAYAAYRAIIAALAADGVREMLPPSAVRWSVIDGSGDLLALSGVGYVIPDRQIAIAYPRAAEPADATEIASTPDGVDFTVRVTQRAGAALPAAVVFDDSFGARLQPLLAENFRRAVFLRYARQEFDEHVILSERPGVVVQELVERRFAAFIPPFDR